MNDEQIRKQYRFNARTVTNLTAAAVPRVIFTMELTEGGFVCSVWEIGKDGPPLHTRTTTNPLGINQVFRDWGYTFTIDAWK